MRYALEFGIRGAYHKENLAIPTHKLASSLASALVCASGGVYEKGSCSADWNMPEGVYRKAWQSKTHFVAISKLDGVMRGPASGELWKFNETVKGFKEYCYDKNFD